MFNFKVHELPTVHRTSIVKAVAGKESVQDYEYIQLPPLDTIARFFAQDEKHFWFQIRLSPDQVCYDGNGNAFLKVRKSDTDDFHFGYSLVTEDKPHDDDQDQKEDKN